MKKKIEKKSKIFVAGHSGLVGSSILRLLQKKGFCNIITKTRKELDLMSSSKVEAFFKKERPEYVFLAAAKVGGIIANDTLSGEFIYQNIMIQSNIIHNSYIYGVKKLLFLGSSCIYPRLCPQPMKEEHLLSGLLEPTNEAYAIAKIAGIKMCQAYNKQYGTNFISVMPTNLYGINDNFNLTTSHVLPALMHKFHNGKKSEDRAGKNSNDLAPVVLWGTGNPSREFLYVDDLADASLFLMKHYNDSAIINVGTAKNITIKELAEKIKNIVGYKGKITWDNTKPDGTPKKMLDTHKIEALGWKPKVSLDQGIKKTYEWYCKTFDVKLSKNKKAVLLKK